MITSKHSIVAYSSPITIKPRELIDAGARVEYGSLSSEVNW